MRLMTLLPLTHYLKLRQMEIDTALRKRIEDAIKRAIPKITNCRVDEQKAEHRREKLLNEFIAICKQLSTKDLSEIQPTAGSA